MVFRQNRQEKPFHGCEEQTALQLRLADWFASELGQSFISAEKLHLEQVLPDLFGFYLVQVGQLAGEDILASSRVSHKRVMALKPGAKADFQAESWALPIKTDSVDVVILPHTLEFSQYPHQLLREVERILVPEGHVVITGFNPLSSWQLWRWVLAWRKRPPWCGHFFTQMRLRDWLTLLGFDVVNKGRYFYRPPLSQTRIMQKLSWLERLGERFWPFAGAGYLLVARKRVVTLTPIRARWQARKQVVATGLAESCVSHQNRDEAVSD